MESRVTYELDKEDFIQAINETISTVVKESVYSRFDSKIVDSRCASQILGISERTLQRWVALGGLIPEPREKGCMYHFSLGYLLRLNPKEISRRLRYNLLDAPARFQASHN